MDMDDPGARGVAREIGRMLIWIHFWGGLVAHLGILLYFPAERDRRHRRAETQGQSRYYSSQSPRSAYIVVGG